MMGVLECVNKCESDNDIGAFNVIDEHLLQIVSNYVVFLMK